MMGMDSRKWISFGLWVISLVAMGASARGAVWFGDLGEASPEITAEQAEAMLKAASGQQADLSPLRNDRLPRIVFVSASDGASPARVSVGAGRGLVEAMLEALGGMKGAPERKLVKLDVVRRVSPIGLMTLHEPLTLEKGVEGIAFDAGSRVAFTPDETAVGRLINDEGNPVLPRIESCWNQFRNGRMPTIPGDSPMYRFSADSYFFDGQAVSKLYRGHGTYESVSDDELLRSAKAAGEYLARSTSESGKFVYEYRPHVALESPAYNMLRHCGTVYAMMEAYGITRDDELLKAAQRGIQYILAAVRPWKVDGQDVSIILDDEEEIKLGGNALAIIALAEYTEATGDKQHLDVMRKLTKWMQLTQEPIGRFGAQKQFWPGGEIADFESDYYPGEAMLALNRMYAIDPDESYLDTAEQAAKYMILIRYGAFTDAELPHDHWLLYSLNELYRQRKNPLYLKHSERLSRVILSSQIHTPLWPDWLGGYNRPPRGNPTATRSEGLCASYQLIRDFGDPALAKEILDSVDLAARFQLQLQYDSRSVMYFDDPQRSIGAFRESLNSYEIRIDTVQHNISSLLQLWRARTAGEKK
jgi:hypothetical protein